MPIVVLALQGKSVNFSLRTGAVSEESVVVEGVVVLPECWK